VRILELVWTPATNYSTWTVLYSLPSVWCIHICDWALPPLFTSCPPDTIRVINDSSPSSLFSVSIYYWQYKPKNTKQAQESGYGLPVQMVQYAFYILCIQMTLCHPEKRPKLVISCSEFILIPWLAPKKNVDRLIPFRWGKNIDEVEFEFWSVIRSWYLQRKWNYPCF